LVVVLSAGRSGTNLVLEVLSGSKLLSPSSYPEDKMVCKSGKVYPYNYLTKTDTIYIDNFGQFADFMKKNWHCKVIFTVRHPFDWSLSKIYRGFGHADDATMEGCIKDLYWASYLFKEATCTFPDRIMPVKMEDVIRDVKKTTEQMCMFLNLPFDNDMLKPHTRMRHEKYKEEYGDKIHDNIDLYKKWDTIYDCFFTKVDFDLKKLFKKVEPLTKTFCYEVDCQ
jgi:hypothetical protein